MNSEMRSERNYGGKREDRNVHRMSDTESPLRTNSYAQCPASQQCGTFAGQTHAPAKPFPPLGAFPLPGSLQRQNGTLHKIRCHLSSYIAKFEDFKVDTRSNNNTNSHNAPRITVD